MVNNTLPVGWEWKTIGDCAKVITGRTPSKKESEYYGNFIPFVKPPELLNGSISSAADNLSEKGAKEARVLPINSVLVSCIGNLGKTGINRVPVAFNQQINAVLFPKEILPKYGFYYFQSSGFKDALESIASATTVSIVNKSKFESLLFPVAPIPEQKQIVGRIEELFSDLDAGVAALERVRAGLKRYKASVLKAAVEGKLANQNSGIGDDTESNLLEAILENRKKEWEDYKTRGEYSPPLSPQNVGELPKLHNNWEWVTLEQLTSAVRVICYGILMPKENVSDGILYVKVKDMKNDHIDVENLNRTSPEIAKQYARASLKTGDLLLAIRGTYGRVAVIPPALDGGNITQDAARLSISKLINRDFVAWYLRSDFAQNYFKRVARGVAVKGVNIADVRLCPVPLPPLDEQKRIVADVERRMSVVGDVESAVDAGLIRAARLRQSVLKSAFEGRLE
jgi:type I restriction enzyme, S subunit